MIDKASLSNAARRFEAGAPEAEIWRAASIHGEADRTVPVEDAAAIARACRRADIRLLTVANADHESVEQIENHDRQLVTFLVQAGFPLARR